MSVTIATPTVAATDFMAARIAAAYTPPQVAPKVYVAAADETQARPVAGAEGPYITLRHLGSNDRWFVGSHRGITTVVIEATAWDEGTSVSRLRPIVDAMFAALHRTTGSAGNVHITGCIRAAAVERQVREDDRLYTQLGAEYRLRLMTP